MPSVATSTSSGRPTVRVPVLSTTSVSTSRSFSTASALRNRIPLSAPCPIATVIEIGVARPTAQGQAMISTATAFTSAYTRRGSGSHTPQASAVSAAMAITVPTK